MVKDYVKLTRADVNEHIPKECGVYITVLRLFNDMDPLPIYVGATGRNKTLKIRLKHYVLILEDPSKRRSRRPIELLAAQIKSPYFEVTHFCTDDYKSIEASLIDTNSERHLPYLLNATGKGRSRYESHTIANKLIEKIALIEKRSKRSVNTSENLIGVQLVFQSGEMKRAGTIVDVLLENNSFLIYWRGGRIEDITLQKSLFSSEYQFDC
ncbi:hypothetical protein [Siminovitchia fortis]|uniref:hypothetical protein n=1 Tax=Siminovitchia fortis TaxID=254758 RepID=UPI00119CC765|nr:hypothetical protein [Siminovitchia fortis]